MITVLRFAPGRCGESLKKHAREKIVAVSLCWFFTVSPSRAGDLAKITPDDFLCRGRAFRSVVYQGKTYRDCSGNHGPSGGIRLELLDLLNETQKGLGKHLVVSSGYRCQRHNLYSWAFWAKESKDGTGVSVNSYHRAAAAADVYVDGEKNMDFYRKLEALLQENARQRGVSLWTRAYSETEVRDPDNRHDHPYIHVHLRGGSRRSIPPAD